MQLNDLSKDALIEVMRRVNDGKVGDTGRTSKAEYIKLLSEQFDPDTVLEAVQDLAQNGTTKPVSLFAKPITSTDTQTAAAQLAQALQAFIPKQDSAPIDADAVREIAADVAREIAADMGAQNYGAMIDYLNNRAAQQINITVNDGESVKLEGTHPLFEKVMRLVAHGANVLLTGAAGAGKTHLAHDIATALNVRFGAISCTAGASESQLLGWLLPTGAGGSFEYNPAPFIDLYESGQSLFLFDELDAADPNFLLVANTAFSNGHIHVAQRLNNPEVKRGANQYLMATANTYGTGADMVYAGRNQLDGATLDRFYIVHVDYNTDLEAQIMGINKPSATRWQPVQNDTAEKAAADIASLHQWLNGVRERVSANNMRRVISTRAFQKARTARMAGVPMSEIKADLLAGWTKDEMRKVGA